VQIKLVADVMVEAGGSVLLVRYSQPEKYDDQTGWFLPDGFLLHGEHPEEAARRILVEQVGIDDVDVTLDHIESMDGDDWHMMFHFRGSQAAAETPRPSDALVEARWFPVDALPPPTDVAHEGWALAVIERIRGRLAARR